MSPSRPFILRPVATSLLMAAILLAGIVAYFQLPVSALPQVDYPTIQVLTFYPGASPDVTATTVTAPLERQFGQLQGLSQMTSTSAGGVSVIVLQFVLSLPIDVAEEEVQSAINAAQSLLPSNLPAPPIYSKTNPADAPVLTLAITSDTMPLSQVEDLVDTRLAPKISQLSGVGLVSISGGQKPAVRIQANPVSSRLLRHQPGRRAHRPDPDQRQRRQGQLRRPAPGLPDRRQRPAHQPAPTTATSSSPTATARPSSLKNVATVVDGVENSKPGRLDERHARRHSQHSAPARRQHHHRRQEHSEAAAAARGQSSRRHQGHQADRPDHQHSVVGQRRRVRADADHRPGRAGHLPLPAQPEGDHHSQRGRAAVAGRHVRRDVRCSATASTTSRSWRSPSPPASWSTTPS